MSTMPRPLLLALALAATLAAGAAHAQAAAPAAGDKAALRAQLEAARADLARSARKVAELSRQLGEAPAPGVVHMERRLAPRPVLGVVLAPDDKAGVRIAAVTPDSAAAKAGLRSGDRLLAINGHDILGSDGALRVDNARTLLRGLDAKTPVRLAWLRAGKRLEASATPQVEDRVMLLREGQAPIPPDLSERIERAIVRVGPQGRCIGKDCGLPLLAETFRWNGLNLAGVDARLGRYFGTDRGVLVLSAGQALPGLQPGDVLRKVDGKPVATPREAMAALEARPAGSSVEVEYLRDRKPATARMDVPKAMPLRFPAPPPPPPPAAPTAPPAPPAPPPPPQASEGALDLGEGVLIARIPAPPRPPAPPSPVAPPQVD